MARSEKLLIDGKTLSEIFDKKFIEDISKLGNIFPINVVLISETEKDGKKETMPIIINHNSRLELEKKILHVECIEPKLLESVSKLLEEG